MFYDRISHITLAKPCNDITVIISTLGPRFNMTFSSSVIVNSTILTTGHLLMNGPL